MSEFTILHSPSRQLHLEQSQDSRNFAKVASLSVDRSMPVINEQNELLSVTPNEGMESRISSRRVSKASKLHKQVSVIHERIMEM